MTKRDILTILGACGWHRGRSTELPPELTEYLEKTGVNERTQFCVQNLFGLVVIKANWEKLNDRVVFGFGLFDAQTGCVTKCNIKNTIRDMYELRDLWRVQISQPIPLMNNFRNTLGVSETIFFDKFGNFYAQGDELYFIGNGIWNALSYVFSEALPELRIVKEGETINFALTS